MRILVALGGNALPRGSERADPSAQAADAELAARLLAEIAAESELVISNGSDTEVGVPALVLALRNALPERELLTVLTEVVVDSADPSAAPAGGSPASPEPHAIVALRSLRILIDAGVLLVCAYGSVPATVQPGGTMRGVETVVDEDLTASLLARRLDADLLMMLTDVDGVRLDRGTAGERLLSLATPAELREHGFEAGSIGRKVEAACRFVEATGRRAAIGSLRNAAAMARGEAGTQVSPVRA